VSHGRPALNSSSLANPRLDFPTSRVGIEHSTGKSVGRLTGSTSSLCRVLSGEWAGQTGLSGDALQVPTDPCSESGRQLTVAPLQRLPG
jgi:hypothetical protein